MFTKVPFLVAVIVLVGCSASKISPTAPVEVVAQVETIAETPLLQPTSTSTKTPSPTPTEAPSPTPTETPSPTPTETSSPTLTPTSTSTPHPLAKFQLLFMHDSTLQSINADGTGLRTIFSREQILAAIGVDNVDDHHNPNVEFSPDGTKMLIETCIERASSGGCIDYGARSFLATIDLSIVVEVQTNSIAHYITYFWAPDSSALYLSDFTNYNGRETPIYILTATLDDFGELAYFGNARNVIWASDGSGLYYTRFGDQGRWIFTRLDGSGYQEFSCQSCRTINQDDIGWAISQSPVTQGFAIPFGNKFVLSNSNFSNTSIAQTSVGDGVVLMWSPERNELIANNSRSLRRINGVDGSELPLSTVKERNHSWVCGWLPNTEYIIYYERYAAKGERVFYAHHLDRNESTYIFTQPLRNGIVSSCPSIIVSNSELDGID